MRVLIDPVWDERAAPLQWTGPKRFFAPTLQLEELPGIDLVLISHDHYDHLGEGTVRRLVQLQPRARWVTPLGGGKVLRGFGVRAGKIKELDWRETVCVAGGACEITALLGAAFFGKEPVQQVRDTVRVQFVIRGAKHAVYYGADSGWWEGFTEIGAEHGPFDLTMLEIGAFNELWKDIHMGPDGAAEAYEALGGPARAGLLMPIHWGLFDLALHNWRQPVERIIELAGRRGWPLFLPEPGRPTEAAAEQTMWWRRQTVASRAAKASSPVLTRL